MDATTKQPEKPKDAIGEGLLEEARATQPAFAVADTPQGPAITRSEEPPSDTTIVWLPSEGEDATTTVADLFTRFGNDSVLLYLEPEPWDLRTNKPLAPEQEQAADKKDPMRKPTRQPDESVAAPMPAVTAALPWSESPIAAAITERRNEAHRVLATQVDVLERAFAMIASAGPEVLAPQPEPPVDEELAAKVFSDPPDTPMNVIISASLGVPQAQQALVKAWESNYRPGMTHEELIEATFPPRPDAPMADGAAWDVASREAEIWVANQQGTEPVPEGDPEESGPTLRGEAAAEEGPPELGNVAEDAVTAEAAARAKVAMVAFASGVITREQVEKELDLYERIHEPVEDIPLIKPEARTAASGQSKSTSSILTDAEHRQRRDAARISAERRRKARELKRRRAEAARAEKQRARGKSSDFQKAMKTFSKYGLTAADVNQNADSSHVTGRDNDSHQRLLDSLHESGFDINTFQDGSGFAKKGGRVIRVGAPIADPIERGNTTWSGDGVRTDAQNARGQRLRPPRPPAPKKPKKKPKWRSAFK